MPEKEQPGGIEGDSHQEMVDDFTSKGVGEKPEVEGRGEKTSEGDSKKIEEIRSTFSPPPESDDNKMKREISEGDKQERVFQERDRADRRIENIGRKRRWIALLTPFIAVASFLGIYKGLKGQDEVNRIKDDENAQRQRTIDRNRASQQVSISKGEYETDDGTKYESKS